MAAGASVVAALAFIAAALAGGAAQAVSPSCTAVDVKPTGAYANGGLSYMCPVDTSRFRNALCNDGTPGVFQVQPSASGSRTWVIWLSGGYECTDAASCKARATNPKTRRHSTSIGVTPRAGHGLLSHDPTLDPALADANTVQVHYCSNDLWSGGYRAPNGPDGFAPADTSTWNFEGRAIVNGVVGTLKNIGLGFGTARTVLLGGTSSGAYGAAVNATDLVHVMPKGARFMLALDAGFTLDIGAFDPTQPAPFVQPAPPTPFQAVVGAGIGLWHARGDATCDARAASAQDRVACYDTSKLLLGGFLAQPTFVAESLIDSGELPGQLCPSRGGKCPVPHDPENQQGQYVTAYGQRMARRLAGDGAASVRYTAFAPDAYAHALLDDDTQFATGFAFAGGPAAPRDALRSWLAGAGTPGGVLVGTGPGVR